MVRGNEGDSGGYQVRGVAFFPQNSKLVTVSLRTRIKAGRIEKRGQVRDI